MGRFLYCIQSTYLPMVASHQWTISAIVGPHNECHLFFFFFFLILTMHPNHNYRHSRRSACDRCRGQKLRCERDHMNGMSCERCLKAQEICITSMNQPAPVILPSNHGQNVLSRDDYEHQRFNPRHKSMPVLHKSSGSGVKKLVHSPSLIPRRHSMKEHHYWGGVSPMPIFPGGSFHSPSADFGFNMPLELGNTMVPVERWSDPISMWSPDAYDLVS